MTWLTTFPQMNDAYLTAFKKAIDEGFRQFSRAYGDSIEAFFSPLQSFLIFSERLMLNTPWPIVIAVIALIAWAASRSIRVVAGSVIILFAIGYFGMWEDTMRTISMILVCTVLSVAIGIPIGIVMSRSAHVQNFVNPILDVMQTMPSFVYLIPVVHAARHRQSSGVDSGRDLRASAHGSPHQPRNSLGRSRRPRSRRRFRLVELAEAEERPVAVLQCPRSWRVSTRRS